MASKLFKGKETYSEELAEAKAIKSGKITPKQYASGEQAEGIHGESKMKSKKMAMGGTPMPARAPMARPARPTMPARPPMMPTRPPMARPTPVANVPRQSQSPVMPPPTMKKGGGVKKMARGGGIEIRGKTRGKFV